MPAACRLRTMLLNSRTDSVGVALIAYRMSGAKNALVLYPQ